MGIGIVDIFNIALAIQKELEVKAPETISKLPPWLPLGLKFTDGTRNVFKCGYSAAQKGAPDPAKLSTDEVLSSIPESERSSFPGNKVQLAAVYKAGYLGFMTVQTASRAAP